MIRGLVLDFLVVSFHVGVVALIAYGLHRAGRDADLTPASRRAVTVGATGALVAWLGLVLVLSRAGFYVAKRELPPAHLLEGVIIPILIGVPALLGWRSLGRVLDAAPAHWLTGIQLYRYGGGIFAIMWLQHDMPWEFGVLGALGDSIVATTAFFVARAVKHGHPAARTLQAVWAIAGILIMATVVALGCWTSPCTTQWLALDQPNVMITAWPLVVTGVYIAPLSIILHVAVLRHLVVSARAPQRAAA